MASTVRKLKDSVKESLPKFIRVLPKKDAPLIWLPKDRALEFERFKNYQNDRNFFMVDYDVYNKKTRTYQSVVDHTHYDIEPNLIIYNVVNRNHQALWRLADPVFCHEEQKLHKAYKYLRAIEKAYDDKYHCDKHFGRYISRNPFYVGVETDWRHNESFKLKDLAQVVELNKERIQNGDEEVKADSNGKFSRNQTLFDRLRFWAYRQDTARLTYEQWQQRLLTEVAQYNHFRPQDKGAMSIYQITSIANSVAQRTFNRHYSISNESFSDYVSRTHTSEIQAKRGVRSASKRWGNGYTKIEPWLDLGISRSTYFRRKKDGLI